MYAHKRNEVKSQIRSARAKYDQQLIDKLQTNPKALYGYMRNKVGLKPRIGQLVKSDGSLTDSDGETAEVLNISFSRCSQVSAVVLLKLFQIALVSCLT